MSEFGALSLVPPLLSILLVVLVRGLSELDGALKGLHPIPSAALEEPTDGDAERE